MVVRNLFYVYVLPNWTPRCGKSRNTGISGHFRPGRPLALREIPVAETEKHNFPALRVPKSKAKVTTLSGMVFCNFFTLCVLPDRTPTGWKSQNTGISGHFGLGTERNPGAGPKMEKCNFPVLGALLGGKSGRPKKFPRKCATFLYLTFWPTGPPRAGNHEIRGF